MKKLFCLLLCLVMVLSLAACGEKEEKEEKEDTTPVQTTEETKSDAPVTAPTEPEVVPLDSFYMDYKEAGWEEAYYMQAFSNGDGTIMVEYKTSLGRKQSNMPENVMVGLAQLYEGFEMNKFNGIEQYEEGDAVASIYITRGDEVCSYSYYGAQVPEDYKTLFETTAQSFAGLMEFVPEYVAQPQLGEGVNEVHSQEILAILSNSGITNPDTLTIMDVAKDEFFASNAGLSGAEGIESCSSCTALMMTVPYSLVVVTVEEGVDVNTVAADFVKSVDWLKWVCVQPSNALIATKGNQVLCLMGGEDLYTQTVSALEAAGWTTVQSLTNPNM